MLLDIMHASKAALASLSTITDRACFLRIQGQGRKWVSKEGNLFCSVLLSPGCKLEDLPQISFVAAVAAAHG